MAEIDRLRPDVAEMPGCALASASFVDAQRYGGDDVAVPGS